MTAAIEPAAADESAFAELTQRHRRELHVHCYRMLASFDEAEDAVQETFLRAWRGRDSFDGSTMFRAWLYRIATNVCLDMIRSRSRRLTTMRTFAEVPLAPALSRSDARRGRAERGRAGRRRRRARDHRTRVPGGDAGPASATARGADRPRRASAGRPARRRRSSRPASRRPNSALQRARATMSEHLPAKRSEWSPGRQATRSATCSRGSSTRTSAMTRRLPSRSPPKTCGSRCPATRTCSRGSDRHRPLLDGALREGEWRLLGTWANRMPTAASYLRKAGRHRVPGVQVRRPAHRAREDRGDHHVRPSCSAAFGLPTPIARRPRTGVGRVMVRR